MSPKETHAQRQVRLQKRADELQEKIDLNGCQWVLKHVKSSVPWFKRQCENKGWWPNETDLEAQFAKSSTEEGQTAGMAKPVDGEDDASVSGSAFSAPSSRTTKQEPDCAALTIQALDSIELHRNYNCYSNTPAKDIMMILTQCEKVAFSYQNLKGLLKHGQRHVPKAPVLEILHFITNCEIDVDHANQNMGDLARSAMAANEKNNRRGRDLVLSELDWDIMGVYKLQIIRADIVLLRLGLDRVVIGKDSGCGLQGWKIKLNYSEHRALVSTPTGGDPVRCFSFFIEDRVATQQGFVAAARPPSAAGSFGDASSNASTMPLGAEATYLFEKQLQELQEATNTVKQQGGEESQESVKEEQEIEHYHYGQKRGADDDQPEGKQKASRTKQEGSDAGSAVAAASLSLAASSAEAEFKPKQKKAVPPGARLARLHSKTQIMK